MLTSVYWGKYCTGNKALESSRQENMTEGFIYQEIGRRIRDLRGKARQKDWAVKIGCDQGYISQVENGVTKPSLAFLKGVVSITGASIDWMLTGRGPKMGDIGTGGEPFSSNAAGAVSYSDELLAYLSRNPRAMQGIYRLMGMDDAGRVILESIGDMEDEKITGLAALVGPGRR